MDKPILHAKRRDVCVLSVLRTKEAVLSLTDPGNDLLHTSLPCHVTGHWPRNLQTVTKNICTSQLRGSGPPC